MRKKNYLHMIAGSCTLLLSSVCYGNGFAANNVPFYAAVDAGIFQGNFNSSYLDQTDVIPQNLTASFQQHGYTEGLAVGYSQQVGNQYLLGVEISANYDSHEAVFQAGAATAAYSDNVNMNNHFDFIFVPGIILTDTLAAYLKVGYTLASVHDSVISPVGFTPAITQYNSNVNANGFVAGLKLEKFLAHQLSVFVEGNYRDYGTVNFSQFQNFTATYTNSSHIYTGDALLGLAYHF